MKKPTLNILAILLITIVPITLFSQAPQKIDFQAIARDAEGIPIASQEIGVKISIVKDSIGGEVVYEETHDTITDISGLFTLQIGNGNDPQGTFFEIEWGNNSYYTQVGIKLEGGANYIDMGVMEMVSVPYALHARNTDSWTVEGDTTYTMRHVGIGTDIPSAPLEICKKIDGDISVLKLRNRQGSGSIQTGVGIDFHHLNTNDIHAQILERQVGNSGHDGDLIFSTNSGSGLVERMRIMHNGNVGIGNSNPSSKLAVPDLPNSASAYFVKVASSSGNFFRSTSSKNYMNDIVKYKSDFHSILKVEPHEYTDLNTNQREIGFIAEDFDELGLQELVIYNENNQPDDIKYDRISLYLIEIIKDQQMKLVEQQNRIEALESRMHKVEKTK